MDQYRKIDIDKKDTGKDYFGEDETIDIEECAKRGIAPPKAKRYRIRIDKDFYVIEEQEISGRELLELAGKVPVERYRIDQKLRGGQTKRIGLDESVSVCLPGLERFMTIPLDQQEG